MKRQLIDRLNAGPVICAEGFLFEVEKRGYLAAGEFVPMVALEHPEALENLIKIFSMPDQILFRHLLTMAIEKKCE